MDSYDSKPIPSREKIVSISILPVKKAFFTGSILIETIFSLDGIGLLSYESILHRDYPVVLGTLFLFTLLGLIAKLLTDISYAFVDPRIGFTSVEGKRND